MDSSDFRILFDIKSALSSRTFRAIRSVEISFLHACLERRIQILDDEWFDQWTGLWNVIKRAKGLLNIQAWVKMDQASGNVMTAEQEARLFTPLMELDRIRHFTVEVTWPANEASEALLLDAPFYLIRDDNPIADKPELAVETVACSLGSS
ncbi:uncharacterized protein N7496_010121 [Penicillium cataractarum]|uniref:Uncharacterized protein n=1 Tax=Penicillium cataractarum TaxID=2100454 RepID=A0A9W9RV37_9EURO|nr:uncharacterized protein N7496_010121 [Penicillium cataractarum]KAJ5364408.1 hypothetical protein N7496_010121 [Penicillium cataractarum]